MKLFENDIDYEVEKFRLVVIGNETLIRCYRNRLLYQCKYIPAIEEAIDAFLLRIHEELWWRDHLT